MSVDQAKQHGIHYTPTDLAAFLADVTIEHLSPKQDRLDILDPACGDGALLYAITLALPDSARSRLYLSGYERDAHATEYARNSLATLNVSNVSLHPTDFLESVDCSLADLSPQRSLLERGPANQQFDVVIANPPYVRTQVLGAKKAQELSRRFGLSGRVDLYHAFTIAMASVLRPGGVLGLLTSNRFLTTRAGASLRHLLRSHFDLRAVYDLGDTKLFNAAVLPVVVVGVKSPGSKENVCRFDRIYECRSKTPPPKTCRTFSGALDALRQVDVSGPVETLAGRFKIDRGILHSSTTSGTWSLSNSAHDDWLSLIQQNQSCTFGDVAHIRVGIKTTADDVFIRDDWDSLPVNHRPDRSLLRSLITHRNARRWIGTLETATKRILYPHVRTNGKRHAIDLEKYPTTAAYFRLNYDRLASREYVIAAGREWYELWVPHNPADWKKPKIVYPDIAEKAAFFLDSSGSLVNGDCYWMTLREYVDDDWLYLMLAVANSSVATRYYDAVFHNKLYAGRRRFMTQYVRQFPLPDLNANTSQEIIKQVKEVVGSGEPPSDSWNHEIDELVGRCFGFAEKIGR